MKFSNFCEDFFLPHFESNDFYLSYFLALLSAMRVSYQISISVYQPWLV